MSANAHRFFHAPGAAPVGQPWINRAVRERLALPTGAGGAQAAPIAPRSDAAPRVVNEGSRLHAAGAGDALVAAR